MVAVGAHIFSRPVQLVLSRNADMRMTGKRHPYKQDYKIGLNLEVANPSLRGNSLSKWRCLYGSFGMY